MRKVCLHDSDFGLFNIEITPIEYDFYQKHRDVFKRMWLDQGKVFWKRFVITFRAFSVTYGVVKDFPGKMDQYEEFMDCAFIYIEEQFVSGKVTEAKKFFLDIVVVAQNRHTLQYLDSKSYVKDPFYNKETRDVFRRLFGPPEEKSSYIKVYCLMPLYLKFGGAICICLRRWLDAPDQDIHDETYWSQPQHYFEHEKQKSYIPKANSSELHPEEGAFFKCYMEEKQHGQKTGPIFVRNWQRGDPRFNVPNNPLYDPSADRNSDWRQGLLPEKFRDFLIFCKTEYGSWRYPGQFEHVEEDEPVPAGKVRKGGKKKKQSKIKQALAADKAIEDAIMRTYHRVKADRKTDPQNAIEWGTTTRDKYQASLPGIAPKKEASSHLSSWMDALHDLQQGNSSTPSQNEKFDLGSKQLSADEPPKNMPDIELSKEVPTKPPKEAATVEPEEDVPIIVDGLPKQEPSDHLRVAAATEKQNHNDGEHPTLVDENNEELPELGVGGTRRKKKKKPYDKEAYRVTQRTNQETGTMTLTYEKIKDGICKKRRIIKKWNESQGDWIQVSEKEVLSSPSDSEEENHPDGPPGIIAKYEPPENGQEDQVNPMMSAYMQDHLGREDEEGIGLQLKYHQEQLKAIGDDAFIHECCKGPICPHTAAQLTAKKNWCDHLPPDAPKVLINRAEQLNKRDQAKERLRRKYEQKHGKQTLKQQMEEETVNFLKQSSEDKKLQIVMDQDQKQLLFKSIEDNLRYPHGKVKCNKKAHESSNPLGMPVIRRNGNQRTPTVPALTHSTDNDDVTSAVQTLKAAPLVKANSEENAVRNASMLQGKHCEMTHASPPGDTPERKLDQTEQEHGNCERVGPPFISEATSRTKVEAPQEETSRDMAIQTEEDGIANLHVDCGTQGKSPLEAKTVTKERIVITGNHFGKSDCSVQVNNLPCHEAWSEDPKTAEKSPPGVNCTTENIPPRGHVCQASTIPKADRTTKSKTKKQSKDKAEPGNGASQTTVVSDIKEMKAKTKMQNKEKAENENGSAETSDVSRAKAILSNLKAKLQEKAKTEDGDITIKVVECSGLQQVELDDILPAGEDMYVEEDGQSPYRFLWVSDLAPTTTGDDLQNLFSKYGQVEAVKIVKRKCDPEGTNFGLVTMANRCEASKCIEPLNKSVVNGRVIGVKPMPGDPTKVIKTAGTSANGGSVFVLNLTGRDFEDEEPDSLIKDVIVEVKPKQTVNDKVAEKLPEKVKGIVGMDEVDDYCEVVGATSVHGKRSRHLRHCANCDQQEEQPRKYKKCQRCRSEKVSQPRYYCGRDCQVADWNKRHKQEHKEKLLW